MITSTTSSLPLKPSTEDIIDISNTRKLLRPTSDSQLTPRKRALARKSSNIRCIPSSSSGLFSPPSSAQQSIEESPKVDNNDDDNDDNNNNDKSILFTFQDSEIHSFEELSVNENKSQGRLIGYGELQVFQLHEKSVSYLQCGEVVYPILPRLKILKISINQFILSLFNPERYWRIKINTNDEIIIKNLENVWKSVCQFRNLYISTSNNDSIISYPLSKNHSIISQNIIHPTSEIKEQQQQHCIKSQSTNSISSISTSLACLALESDETSTFVEEDESNYNLQRINSNTNSNVSSLDLILEEFPNKDDEFNETSKFYTPNASFHNTITSKETLMLSPPFQYDTSSSSFLYSKHHQTIKTRSSRSRSTSLYQLESSWMDPTNEDDEDDEDDDDDGLITSTPNTERYIKLNLNPSKRKNNKLISESLLQSGKKNKDRYRLSSYQVYKLIEEESEDNSDVSIKGFLKSFLG